VKGFEYVNEGINKKSDLNLSIKMKDKIIVKEGHLIMKWILNFDWLKEIIIDNSILNISAIWEEKINYVLKWENITIYN